MHVLCLVLFFWYIDSHQQGKNVGKNLEQNWIIFSEVYTDLDVSEEFTRLLKQTDFDIKSTEAGEIQFSDEDFEKFCNSGILWASLFLLER